MTDGSKRPSRKAYAPFIIVVAVSLVSAGAIAFGTISSSWNDTAPESTQQSASGAPSTSTNSSAASTSNSSGASSDSSPAYSMLGEHTISSQSRDDDRMKNLACATQLLDGTMIGPGDTLSLNTVLGDLETASGYYVASESADGHTGAFRGGGASQVASALYVAAVRADLNIVERHAHEETSDYAPAGLDAEIGSADKDLKIKNPFDTPVLLSATAQGQVVHVQVLGPERDDGKTFDITATIVQEGADGTYSVETRKAEYADGQLKSTERLFVDSYRASKSGFISQQGAATATK